MYAGGSSSSSIVNPVDLGYTEDCDDATNCRGSSLSSMLCPADRETVICFDLLAMYSVTADLGKKIYGVASR